MPAPGRELSSINFEAMLGGPLTAVVNAQAQAAMTTVDFIKQVGFKSASEEEDLLDAPKTAEPIYVTFTYPKELSPYQPAVEEEKDEEGNVTTPARAEQAAVWQDMELKVPILTMLPIPFIRVEETTIDFNAKINSVESHESSRAYRSKWSGEVKVRYWIGSASFKVSGAYQSKTRSGIETRRTYSMSVHIKAVQDEMPAGTERLLGILENAISAQPTDAPAPMAG
ncbi:MAG: DUF2589 domain-containing protein [Acidobacteriota bacterium]|nr:DUF2589 domain-containing protein [bacterium]MDE2883464.1 DUF2589 domain-containing protein [Acidobacteriota bacterium]